MKKIVLLIIIFPLLFVSCKKTYTPVAVFHTETLTPDVGQEVFFYNDSRESVSFEWDFGDGYTSTDANPVHIFTATGSYEVKLTAIAKNNLEDKASLTLSVLVPTLLEVQVVEYYDHDIVVPDASIILYPTLADWDAQTNMLSEGFTDEYGIAVFSGLEDADHYLDVWEQNHDNYALRSEDPEFIHVMRVIPHMINRFTAYVDYVEHGSGSKGRSRSVEIKKIVRSASDLELQRLESSSENWQDLYNRSFRISKVKK
jgi:PKD repeat protein